MSTVFYCPDCGRSEIVPSTEGHVDVVLCSKCLEPMVEIEKEN